MKHTLAIVFLLFVMVNMAACGKNAATNEEQTIETATEDTNAVSEDKSIEETEKQEVKPETSVSSVSVETDEDSTENSSEEEQEDSSVSDRENDDALKLYDGLLKKVVSGEEKME